MFEVLELPVPVFVPAPVPVPVPVLVPVLVPLVVVPESVERLAALLIVMLPVQSGFTVYVPV